MNTKALAALSILAVLVAAAAGVAVHFRGSSQAREAPTGHILEGLAERGNEVGKIRIETGDETFTLTRRNDAWTLEERGGYPVKFEEVRKTVSGLARLEPLEAMTSRPELYDRLGVADPSPGETSAVQVTLEDGGGTSLGSLIVGNHKPGRGRSGVYVRRPGEAQSWLANGDVQIPRTLTGWVDTEILKVDQKRVQDVRIEGPGGASLHLFRENQEGTTFAVDGVPEGRELVSPAAANPVGNALSWLNFEDVAPAEAHPAGEDAVTATFRTFDGLVVTVRTANDESGKTWARFTASYEEPPETKGEAEEASPPEEGEAGETSPPEESSSETAEGGDQPPAPEDVRREAEELQEKLAPWAFALPSYKAGYLRKTLEELLKPLPEPEPEETPGGRAGS